MSNFLTKQDVVKEFIACGKSPSYFIDNYCKLYHPQKGQLPFKTWKFQKDLLKDFENFQHNIIVKSRQLGISWTAAAYAVWLMMFHREKNIMVISIQFKVAVNIVKKVKFMIKGLPEWFKQLAEIEYDNKTNLTLTNGSGIAATGKATDVGRSEALSLLILDEAAHIENMDEIWAAAAPTMAAGGRSIALSSPKGVGSWFHKEYMRAEKGENEFHPTKLMWDVHPERDDEWERKERNKYSSVKDFEQEYMCSWLASGDTVINSNDLKRIYETIKTPIFKTGFDKNLYIWEEHIINEQYLVVADVARGDGSDYSAIHVIKLGTIEQVAEYKGKTTIDIFAKLLFDVGKEYNEAMIVVENNMLGWEVCQKLLKMEYKNLYFEEKGTHEYIPPYQALNIEKIGRAS